MPPAGDQAPAVVVPMRQRRTTRIFQLAAAVIDAVLALGLGIWGAQNHNRANDVDQNYASVQTVLAAPDAAVTRGTVTGTGVSGTATVVSRRASASRCSSAPT